VIPVPPLPTDNLYKFMAIIGVVTTALSILAPASVGRTIALQQFEIERDLSLLEAEQRRIETLPPEQEMAEHDQHARELRRNLEEVKYKNRVLEYSIWTLRLWKAAAAMGIVGGLLLSVSGFWLWYTRLQRFQDRALAEQAAQSMNDATDKRI